MIRIAPLTVSSASALKDICHLLSQLRRKPSERSGSLSDLREVVKNKHAILMVAKDDGKIVGMATLYVMPKVGKRVGCVEDVVVGKEYRGQGLGEKLMRSIIAEARKKKVGSLFLTSASDRAAANVLYKKLGFEIVETNPYKLRF